MLTRTIPMQWLWDLAEEYRSILRRSLFYKTVAAATCPADLKWIRQLYYLSCDFTAAVALRYGSCHDPRFRDAFAQHAAEEVEHPADLTHWMREYGFLAPDEPPTSVAPTLETLALGSYFVRSVTRESLAHQIITLNLMTEGMACDFYSAVNPKLAELGLFPKGYWIAHQEADVEHQLLGLDLIPQSEKGSPNGQAYTRTLWEVASLWAQVFESWTGIPQAHKVTMPTSPRVTGWV
jgi:hypothetical protein